MVNRKSLTQLQLAKGDLWLLWSLGLTLRLVYLWMASTQFGFERLSHFADDSQVYLSIADHYLTGSGDVADALLKAGPGYGLMLAGIKWLFGANLLWPTLANVLLGSLAPIAIYLLALYLIESRVVAVLAGLISAVSFTSLSLSCSILTDQPFFTLHAFAMVSFVLGFRTSRLGWFVAAGVLASIATLVRSAGEFWPWIFLAVALLTPLQPAFRSRWEMIRRASVTSLIMLLCITGWSCRNYEETGLYTYNTNGIYALRGYLLNHAVCRNTPGCVWSEQGLAWSIEDGDKTAPVKVAYANAKARVARIIEEHPDWVIQTYLVVLMDNVRTSNSFMLQQLPRIRPFTDWVYGQLKKWIWAALVLMSVMGIGLLLRRKRILAGLMLGAGYGYFTLVCGFSFMQGSRLYYPAEIGWAILVAYILVEIGLAIRRRIGPTRLFRWGSTMCLSGLIIFGGCTHEPIPGLALKWDQANSEEQSIVEVPFGKLANMNVDVAVAAESRDPSDGSGVELYVTASGQKVYHPVKLTHRCLQFIAAFEITRDKNFLGRAEKYAERLRSMAELHDQSLLVPYSFDFKIHSRDSLRLAAPWYSSMAQGEFLSIAVRLYHLTKKSAYRTEAEQIFESLTRIQGRDDDWVSRIDSSGYLWLEEYTEPNRFDQTLNGYVATLYGVYDYWWLTREASAKQMWNCCLTTLKHYLPQYRRKGELSYYCLGHHFPATQEYHTLHVSMLNEMSRLSGDTTFAHAAEQFLSDWPATYGGK